MAWPDTRICNGCRKIKKANKCKIDISDFFNCREGTAFVCSDKCADNAKKNWLK